MKRLSNRTQLRLITEISITPLLDLVIMLMFVFLLAAPLLKHDKALTLPVTRDSGDAAPPSSVRLFMHKDMSVTLDGAMLARVDLPFALKHFAAKHPEAGIEVRMHRDLSVQHLMELMDTLNEAGIKKTAVATHADEL